MSVPRLEKFRLFKRRASVLKDSGVTKSRGPRGYAPAYKNPGPVSPMKRKDDR